DHAFPLGGHGGERRGLPQSPENATPPSDSPADHELTLRLGRGFAAGQNAGAHVSALDSMADADGDVALRIWQASGRPTVRANFARSDRRGGAGRVDFRIAGG